MIVPELNNYVTDLGAPDLKLLNISLFALAALVARPLSGKLTDIIGRIPIMIIGVLVCIVIGFLYPISTAVLWFFSLRFFHGFSSGFKPTATTSFLADIIPAQKRGQAMGILGMSGSLGMGIGPFFGSWIAQDFSINTMFYASSIVALFSITVLMGMKETLVTKRKFKLSDLLIKPYDLFDFNVIAPVIVMFLSVFSFAIILNVIPDFTDFLEIKNRGFFNLILIITSIVVRFFGGSLSDRYGRVQMLRIGISILFFGMVYLSFVSTKTEFIIAAIIIGIATGINSPTVFAWNTDLADKNAMGRSMSSLFIGLEFGIILASLIGMKIYNNSSDNFNLVFLFGASTALAALLYLSFIKKDKIHTFKP